MVNAQEMVVGMVMGELTLHNLYYVLLATLLAIQHGQLPQYYPDWQLGLLCVRGQAALAGPDIVQLHPGEICQEDGASARE